VSNVLGTLVRMTQSPDYIQEFLDRGTDRLGLHLYPDPAAADAPVVVVWPAMGTPARYYQPLAQRLHSAGLGVVVVDLRGTGSSTPPASRRSRYGYAELTGDVGAVLAALKPRLDGRRVVLLGHSLGGQLCALHLALSPYAVTPDADVDGLVLVAVGLPWYRSYPRSRARGVLAYTQSIVALTALLRVWPGWGFGGRQARGVIRDWGYTARHGRFPLIDGVDAESALSSVRTPVLAISVEGDEYTPGETLDHLCAKVDTAPVERVNLTSADAGAPLDHFKWVRASGAVADLVARFASAQPARHDQREHDGA